jgi:hypothetical protein
MNFFFLKGSWQQNFLQHTSLHKFLFLLNSALTKEKKAFMGFFASAGTVVPGTV